MSRPAPVDPLARAPGSRARVGHPDPFPAAPAVTPPPQG